MPQAWNVKSLYVKNIKYRHKNPDKAQDESDVKKEEVADIKDEELGEDGKSYLRKKERKRQRLLEERDEKKAQTANDNHPRLYQAGERPFLCAECPIKTAQVQR